MWNFHVDDSDKGIYDMILGRDLLTEFGLNLVLSVDSIEADDGPLKLLTAPMFDLGIY